MKKRGRVGLIVVVLCGAVGSASASSFTTKTLGGTFGIHGSSLVDADPSEEMDTHMYFFLERDAAKDLYHALREKPERDACLDDGSLSKTSRDIVCTESPKKEYECSFSVDVVNHKLSHGKAC